MNSKLDFSLSMSSPVSRHGIIDPCKDKLQVLEEQETLGRLKTNTFIHGYLVSSFS
jgi:E3 ubiquitin-protein ligase RNF1/2